MAKSSRKKQRIAAEQPAPQLKQSNDLKLLFILFALLAVVTAGVYSQSISFGFITMDDYLYVTHNEHVKMGLTPQSIHWAFTGVGAGNWHPLTWLSLMLDYETSEMNPRAYHTTNIFLHIINTLLLLFVFHRMTGRLWPSAFAAGLFALHPLHVESVAWISERKDVLSTMFWLLAMLAYVEYVKRPSAGRYALVAAAFALGIMAKPMLVTFPLTLLLLDIWPLRRLSSEKGGKDFTQLVVEKAPLFVITFISCCVTFWAQRVDGAVAQLEQLPFEARVPNAIVSCGAYLVKMIYPMRLAPFYPHLGQNLPSWQVVLSALMLVSLTILAFRSMKTRPWFTFGWLWYLITLVPVIGLVQVGSQAMADRYTYIPFIGIFAIIAWGVPELVGRGAELKPERALTLGSVAVIILLALTVRTYSQISFWRNDITIWNHTVSITRPNSFAQYNLACAYDDAGKHKRAIEEYIRTLELEPGKVSALNNLGVIYMDSNQSEKARDCFSEALSRDPDHVQANSNMGMLMSKLKDFDASIMYYTRANEAAFDDGTRLGLSTAYSSAGIHYAEQGRLDEAIPYFEKAIQTDPANSKAHYNLARAYDSQNRLDLAADEYRKAVELDPRDADAHNNLGVVLGQQGSYDEAVEHFTKALQIKPDFPQAQMSLQHFRGLARGK